MQRWSLNPDAAGGPYEFGDSRLPERFWDKVAVTESGCWRWTASKVNGYGVFRSPGTSKYVHVIAYTALIGPIPDGWGGDHLCHTNDPSCFDGVDCAHRSCLLPRHVQPVPLVENIARKHIPPECPHGHLYTPETTYTTPTGARKCRICIRDRNRAAKARLRAARAARRAS